jgi:hypothetical protein
MHMSSRRIVGIKFWTFCFKLSRIRRLGGTTNFCLHVEECLHFG